MVIFNMRAKRPGYNLISNNCQNFAVAMLEAIQVGAHRDFATSFAIYKRAIGPGRLADLFLDDVAVPETEQEPTDNIVQNAQHVMEEQTTTLDNHHCIH